MRSSALPSSHPIRLQLQFLALNAQSLCFAAVCDHKESETEHTKLRFQIQINSSVRKMRVECDAIQSDFVESKGI